LLIASALLDNGRTLLVLGLSTQNRERLAQGQPIQISRETHGVAIPADVAIMIFAGETEESMGRSLGALIGPETVINQMKPQ